MKLKVVRISRNSDTTFVAFVLEDGTAVAVGIELLWRDNAQGVSRIPAGTYRCVRFQSPTFKREVWRILGVPGRDLCLIHPANLAVQLRGCIATGNSFDRVAPKGHAEDDGVAGSIEEFNELMELTKDEDEIELTIVDEAAP